MSLEQKKAFRPVLIGLVIFAICSGANTMLSPSYVLFASKFDITVTQVVIGNSFMTGGGFLMMQFSGNIIKKIGARFSMLISLAGIAVGFLIMAMASSIYVVWMGFAFLGCTHAFGQTVATATVLRSWVHKNQGKYMGIVFGSGVFGTAIWPFLGGQFFTQFSLSTAFLISIPCFIIPAYLAIIFLIKNKPEDCGVKAIGWEEVTATPAAPQAAVMTDKTPAKKFNIFATVPFWLCGVGMLLSVVLNSQLTLMATSLQMAGMSVAVAANINSLANLMGFPANYLAGWLRDKFGIRGFATYVFVLVFICSLCLRAFFTSGSTIALWLFVATNAIGRPYININPYASTYIYKENAGIAQPRIQSIASLGSMFLTPIISGLAEKWGGYANVAWLWMACAIVSIVVWNLAITFGDKMNMQKTNKSVTINSSDSQ